MLDSSSLLRRLFALGGPSIRCSRPSLLTSSAFARPSQRRSPSVITASWRVTVRRIPDTPRTGIPRQLQLDTDALARYDAYRAEL